MLNAEQRLDNFLWVYEGKETVKFTQFQNLNRKCPVNFFNQFLVHRFAILKFMNLSIKMFDNRFRNSVQQVHQGVLVLLQISSTLRIVIGASLIR